MHSTQFFILISTYRGIRRAQERAGLEQHISLGKPVFLWKGAAAALTRMCKVQISILCNNKKPILSDNCQGYSRLSFTPL